MGQERIKSCVDCQTNCCRIGPGPYEILPFQEYFERQGFHEKSSYNTQCASLGEDLKCQEWGTDRMPIGCQIMVCPVRDYSSEELQRIAEIKEKASDYVRRASVP